MKYQNPTSYANAIMSTTYFKPTFVWNTCNKHFIHQGSDQRAYHWKNQYWYKQKNSCIDHLCLIGHCSKTHKQAMNDYRNEWKKESRQKQITKNIFRVAITDLKLRAASKHFETLLSVLACCDTDIWNIGHSRKNMDSIIYCIEKVINRKSAGWLSMLLPSTRLPLHYWATVDKGTPSRITSQAVLIVAWEQNGTPYPIPVAAPDIYFDFQGGSYSILAKQLINAIEKNFSSDILSRLCGVAADGLYQASGFRNQLYEMLFIPKIHKDLALPITWDPAHLLNLGVTDVRDSKSESAEFFR